MLAPQSNSPIARLKTFEGVPPPFDQKKRKVIPDALKVIRMKNHRKYCVLGDLCNAVGWKKKDLVEKLEEKRKAKSHKFYEKKLDKLRKTRKATELPELKALREKLAKFGY